MRSGSPMATNGDPRRGGRGDGAWPCWGVQGVLCLLPWGTVVAKEEMPARWRWGIRPKGLCLALAVPRARADAREGDPGCREDPTCRRGFQGFSLEGVVRHG